MLKAERAACQGIELFLPRGAEKTGEQRGVCERKMSYRMNGNSPGACVAFKTSQLTLLKNVQCGLGQERAAVLCDGIDAGDKALVHRHLYA